MISEYDHKVALVKRVREVKNKFISELRAYPDFDEEDVERFLVQNGYVSPPRFTVSFEIEVVNFMNEDEIPDEILDVVEDAGYTIVNGVNVSELRG